MIGLRTNMEAACRIIRVAQHLHMSRAGTLRRRAFPVPPAMMVWMGYNVVNESQTGRIEFMIVT